MSTPFDPTLVKREHVACMIQRGIELDLGKLMDGGVDHDVVYAGLLDALTEVARVVTCGRVDVDSAP